MASFMKWSEWVTLREDNARKRAVRAALAGTGNPLPGSAAACPSTNPRAMAAAARKGVVAKPPLRENDAERPDYSFDRWLQKAKEFGDDVNDLRTKAEKGEKDLDKRKKDADKEEGQTKDKDSADDGPDDERSGEDTENKETKEVWDRLKQIHLDRIKAVQGKSDASDVTPASRRQR